MELKEKVAVVTGGASGLGEATVRRYYAEGVKVAIFDMNEVLGQRLANELGHSVIFCQVNVCDEDSVSTGIEATLGMFGAIHLCSNYAGIADAAKTVGSKGPFPLDLFNKVININLVGTFNVLRLIAEAMSKQEPVTEEGTRGVIINTASVAAFEGQMGQAAYSASKGGIVGMTLPIARDLAAYGIRVNTIAPGLIQTPLVDSLPKDTVAALSANVPFPYRLGKPDEIAQLAQSIAENEYINGEVIRCDGAIRMQPQ
ncbi:3-hydroxyacyl-CoA dehydrogenase [Haliea sp.]|uniref:3-hydroxyacyl-CoA dehydrogenase n=1 Tax=Haliea sp. TaxID=1932666 RepID=UPI000C6B8C75|nr:3-hydroxyacyl-CoA dehydrogenase [Haliea sp.]MAD61952.1 3-hydroxyacyl-CoA dehydrogenase [Haliea sp.]MAY91673.1 3-hydroxyacyl-CoA dehydrogenase [Haliea sp.]MBP69128.1 3-hydroxyacyl-CoA dehydrogenase [Haliea sp.]